MNFYYHAQMNICAEENWVVEYLVNNGEVEDSADAKFELHTRREFCGWFACEVSNTIDELINDHYGTW